MTKADGSNLTAAGTLVPTNLFLSALFSDITLTMNETVVEGGHYLYPYKAMMSSLLQFDVGMKKTQLEAAGYHVTAATRKGWIDTSKSCEFLGPLHLDVFAQSKYLLSGVNVRIKMSRSKLEFLF